MDKSRNLRQRVAEWQDNQRRKYSAHVQSRPSCPCCHFEPFKIHSFDENIFEQIHSTLIVCNVSSKKSILLFTR